MIYGTWYIKNRTLLTEAGCWQWTKAIGSHGYGQISRGRLVHRLSYELYVGPIPEGKLVLHTCDNRACCNPEHLFLGNHYENTSDCIAKDRFKFVPPKIPDEVVAEVRIKLAKGETQDSIAKQLSISQAQVSRINTNTQRKI